MKIAIVHDYLKEYGGAERVLEALHEIYPDAPVYTLVYLPEFLGPHKGRFKNWDIRTSFLQGVPFKDKLISPFRLLAPFVFKTFDLSQFDIVIVSATGAYSPNTIKCHPELISGSDTVGNEMPKPFGLSSTSLTAGAQGGQVRHDKSRKPVHICYCHTPPRYLYGYATAREWKKNPFFKVLGEVANHFLRLVDYRSAQNVDYFIANSEEVRGRIKKFYRKDAVVVYPPVDTAFSSLASSVQLRKKKLNANTLDAKRYYLAGGRLARPKHIDLIIEAFQKLNRPLKIFGRGFAGFELDLKSKILNHKSQIEFLGEVTDEDKFELMRNAKAYIFASEDEDFGITPVEAMAQGTPVIAYRSGGVQESVVDPSAHSASSGQAGSRQVTGVFFDKLNTESLLDAIKRFDTIKIRPEDCRKRAEQFSKERFVREIKEFIKKIR